MYRRQRSMRTSQLRHLDLVSLTLGRGSKQLAHLSPFHYTAHKVDRLSGFVLSHPSITRRSGDGRHVCCLLQNFLIVWVIRL